MRSTFRVLSVLVWLTQLGLSVAGPPVLFILLGRWLRDRFGLGSWVLIVGIVLGVLGAVGGLISSFQTLHRMAKQEPEPPSGFNDHD